MTEVDELFRAYLLDQLREQDPERLPHLAAEALADGFDSPWLRRAAGVSAGEPETAREYFGWAMAELGYPTNLPLAEARRLVVFDVAQRMANGDLDPFEGADILAGQADDIEPGGDLGRFQFGHLEFPHDEDNREPLAELYRAEAAALAERGFLRRWVYLSTDEGFGPLRSGGKSVSAEDLGLAEELAAEIYRWHGAVSAGRRRWNSEEWAKLGEAAQRLRIQIQDALGETVMVECSMHPVRPRRPSRGQRLRSCLSRLLPDWTGHRPG